ncbi:hypothetical protein GF324_01795 [bacterium]|nr:hypothetical protein [bacterium]
MKLQAYKVHVILVDSNTQNVDIAQRSGLRAHHGNILADYLLEEIDFSLIGKVIAVTGNDEVNSLAAIRFQDLLSTEEVYQLPPTPKREGLKPSEAVSRDLRGHILFTPFATFEELTSRFRQGAEIREFDLQQGYTCDTFSEDYGDTAIPLFVIQGEGRAKVVNCETGPDLKEGEILVCMVGRKRSTPGKVEV